MKRIRIKKWLVILLILFAAFVLSGLLLVDVIPPRSLTAGRMDVLKRRIQTHAKSQNQLPKTLSEAVKIPDYDNETVDAWKRPILYRVDGNGNVTLTSFGKDGVPGGAGENADLIGVFPSRDATSKWCDESVEWTVKPTQR